MGLGLIAARGLRQAQAERVLVYGGQTIQPEFKHHPLSLSLAKPTRHPRPTDQESQA